MSFASKRSAWIAAAVLSVTVLAVAAPLWAQSAQSGKPEYDPQVEEVARSIFFELMSPY